MVPDYVPTHTWAQPASRRLTPNPSGPARHTLPIPSPPSLHTPAPADNPSTLRTPSTVTPLRGSVSTLSAVNGPHETATLKSTVTRQLLAEWQVLQARMQQWLTSVNAVPPPRPVHATAHASWLRQCQALEEKEASVAAAYEQAGGLMESEAEAKHRSCIKNTCLQVLHATDPACFRR